MELFNSGLQKDQKCALKHHHVQRRAIKKRKKISELHSTNAKSPSYQLDQVVQNISLFLIPNSGHRESAFLHALTSAGVSHAVARACSMGKLVSCGCGKASIGSPVSWRWSGCNHNIDFGIQFSKMLLDSREKAKDIRSRINTHNNQVGRNVSWLYISWT